MSEDQGFRWTVSVILFGALFLGVSDTQLVPPLLPLIAQDLETSPGRAGIIVTSYSLAAALFALFAGPISDRIGRKAVLTTGLSLFTLTSFFTYHVSTFGSLLILRTFTGLAAGTISTSALSLAADYYPYAQRGRAMGIISMSYFSAFVIAVPAGALAASRLGWQSVFGFLAVGSGIALLAAVARLPVQKAEAQMDFSPRTLLTHFSKPDRAAGIAAAFLTSGGIVGFLTYVGAWLQNDHGLGVDRIGLVFMVCGLAATTASPLSGWLSDHAGKRPIIVWSNVALAVLCVLIARAQWGFWLMAGIAALSIAASARQAPLHALTAELAGREIRGEYIAMRNAASQLGIASVATVSGYAFDSGGFSAVSMVAAFVTLLIPLACIWMPEPRILQ